jgi:protein-L-isoaspartate(D-aspartate) O-methyltransferase
MVDELDHMAIGDVRVLDAMERVPRHLFVPPSQQAFAYENRPLPIGYGQTISQPYMVARALAALELEGTERVLDVGTGSGYQAALLGMLAREVYTVEIIPELCSRARMAIARLGFNNVHVELGDGSRGLPRHQPYDAIICAAAAPEIPRALLDQLADGGRLVMPVGEGAVQSLLQVKKVKGRQVARFLCRCTYVPLVGVALPARAI